MSIYSSSNDRVGYPLSTQEYPLRTQQLLYQRGVLAHLMWDLVALFADQSQSDAEPIDGRVTMATARAVDDRIQACRAQLPPDLQYSPRMQPCNQATIFLVVDSIVEAKAP